MTPELPAYIYGRECGPNERVYTEAQMRYVLAELEKHQANTKRIEWVAANLRAISQDVSEDWFLTHIGQNGAAVVTKSEHGFIDAVDRAMDQNPIKK